MADKLETPGAVPVAALEFLSGGGQRPASRALVAEAPIALEFNGIAYAVMMATPTDLEDFATGFALSEGLADSAQAIAAIAVAEVENGWIVRTTIPALTLDRLSERIRTRAAESSCGLCGIENLEAISRPLPGAAHHPRLAPAAIFTALAALRSRQTLGRLTGGAHAAAHVLPDGSITRLREDVGRHCALDKLTGAMARAAAPLSPGFLLSTARCSYEIVEKAARCGATTIVTISLPTSMAVERARQAGLSLWSLARADSVLLVVDGSEQNQKTGNARG